MVHRLSNLPLLSKQRKKKLTLVFMEQRYLMVIQKKTYITLKKKLNLRKSMNRYVLFSVANLGNYR